MISGHILKSAFAGIFLLCVPGTATATDIELPSGGPFVATPQPVVEKMLELARVSQRDFVLDLGSGDGRIVLTAARKYRARGMGVDIDAELVEASNAAARKQGVGDLASFRRQNVLDTRIADATVLTLYLLPEMMRTLQARIYTELKPGSRVVSHDFQFDGWEPDRSETVDLQEKYHVTGTWQSSIHLWIVPAKVEGRWRVVAGTPDGKPFTINFKQQHQRLGGNAEGATPRSLQGRLEGRAVHFRLAAGERRGGAEEYRGIVDGDRMRGKAVLNGRAVEWAATRVATAR
jgi:hypothetical protein